MEATRKLEEAVKLRPEAMAPKPEPRRYRIEIRGGVSYDDNASLAPTHHVLGLRTPPRRSAAEIAMVRLEYDLIQTQPDRLTASYQIFSNYYNSLQNLDVLNHTWGGNYTHRGKLGPLPAWYGAQYIYDYLELDGAVFLKERNSSTFTLFDFDRKVVTLSIGWNY